MKCICFNVPEKKMNGSIENIDSFLNRRFTIGNIYDFEIYTDYQLKMATHHPLRITRVSYRVKYQSKSGIENICYSEKEFNKLFKELSEYRDIKLEEILS